MDILTLTALIHENGGRSLWDAETHHNTPQLLQAYNVGGKLGADRRGLPQGPRVEATEEQARWKVRQFMGSPAPLPTTED